MAASIIGYAQADFATLRAENNLYIDRTAYIRSIEDESNRNLIFVRPRRFGKSLWLSILHYYYAIEHKDKFDTLFGNLAIGQNPTPLRNSYIVLRMQFAGIDVETEKSTYQGFRANVMTGIIDCMTAYPAYFSEKDKAEIKATDMPANMMQTFLSLYKGQNTPYKLYILIDEYDQFANELVALDADRFQAIIGSTGYVRKVYEMMKNAINEGVVNRFFATGVSPLTVDSLTSGFNISTSLGLELDYHDLMGFKRDEVAYILKQVGATDADIPNIITDLKEWYNGYLFHEEAEERLYNSDMIMYFAFHYERRKKYPRRMLDANIATDYTKVKKIFNIKQQEQKFIPTLKALTSEGVVSSTITEFFNLERGFSEFDLISLLFYMGWITIQEIDEGMYNFQIPNRVIQELYYQYFIDIIEREYGLNETATKVQNALKEFSKNNNPQPFLDIIKTIIEKDLSFRDAQGFDEKHLKMLMIPYLSLSASHYVKSEEEWQNGYIDVLMLKRPTVTTKYNFLIELKYIKKGDAHIKDKKTKASYVEKVEKEAREQVQKYLQSDNAKRIPNLKAWLFVLVGSEWHLVEEIPMP
jgi:hypothetical protein